MLSSFHFPVQCMSAAFILQSWLVHPVTVLSCMERAERTGKVRESDYIHPMTWCIWHTEWQRYMIAHQPLSHQIMCVITKPKTCSDQQCPPNKVTARVYVGVGALPRDTDYNPNQESKVYKRHNDASSSSSFEARCVSKHISSTCLQNYQVSNALWMSLAIAMCYFWI